MWGSVKIAKLANQRIDSRLGSKMGNDTLSPTANLAQQLESNEIRNAAKFLLCK
jgi:hypothetical protein